MSKIDKTDIENIKLITKEAKLSNLSRIKIKKGDYEIELSSESSNVIAPVSQKIPTSNIKTSEEIISNEEIKEENTQTENTEATEQIAELSDKVSEIKSLKRKRRELSKCATKTLNKHRGAIVLDFN